MGRKIATSQEMYTEAAQKINTLLLDVYTIMPSLGAYPFTMLTLSHTALSGLSTEPSPVSTVQLIVLKRTDFNTSDLMDYLIHTKEYNQIPQEKREAFLDSYRHKLLDKRAMEQWTENVISLGMGIVKHLAWNHGVDLKPLEVNFPGLDARFGFHSKNLLAYQLFDMIPIDQH